MPIQRSAGAEIRQLIEALGGPDETSAASAVARLAVIGPRAVEHLLHEFPTATGRVRAGILHAFELIADARVLPAARAALKDGSAAVQIAAIGTLRALLASDNTAAARDAFDAIVAVTLDRQRI